MAIDIFSIQPSVISRDLSGKSFFIYGMKKSGKTTNSVKFPKPLLIACEKGYNMLSGVYAQPVNKWTEMLSIKKQLLKDVSDVEKGLKSETMFKTVVVDTADLAYDFCEAYILAKENAEYLDETASKRGYKATKKEYDNFFQEIVKAGYTLVTISHSTTVQIKKAGIKYDVTQPTVDRRGLEVLSRLVDVFAYAACEYDDSGKTNMYLYMRGNQELEAGTRNPYMSEKIPFTYNALLKDMQQAIDKQAQEGANVTDNPTDAYQDQSEIYNFEEILDELKVLAEKALELEIGDQYAEIVEKYLGKGRRLRDCDKAQLDLMVLILNDLKDIKELQ